MSASFVTAVAQARATHGTTWEDMEPKARNAAIFHALCRIDSNCQRTGTGADADLPPCPASDTFLARRNCRLAGPRAG
jgi:hypothetical protein